MSEGYHENNISLGMDFQEPEVEVSPLIESIGKGEGFSDLAFGAAAGAALGLGWSNMSILGTLVGVVLCLLVLYVFYQAALQKCPRTACADATCMRRMVY